MRFVISCSFLELVSGRSGELQDGDGAQGIADEQGRFGCADRDEVESDESASPGCFGGEVVRGGVDRVDSDLRDR